MYPTPPTPSPQTDPSYPHAQCCVQVVRKERAAGVVPQRGTVYEVLEELAITVQRQLVDAPLPFCAFNGGGDVFVDVGNKSLGLEALMSHLGYQTHQVSREGGLGGPLGGACGLAGRGACARVRSVCRRCSFARVHAA